MSTRANVRINTVRVIPPNGIRFPINGESPSTANVSIFFANPQSNGLPIWGPSNAGVTVIRKIKSIQHTGYYARFWWSTGDPSQAGGADFIANANAPRGFWGFHPYPVGGASGTTHNEEIAADSSDFTITLAGGADTVPTVHGQIFTEGIRVIHNGDSTKTLRYYPRLPSTSNGDVIQCSLGSTYGTTNPTNPMITIGESPWYAAFQHERGGFTLGPIKIIAKVLSESDLVLESADMTRLVTADAIANIWWGKTTFDSVNDLTCDYGTGRAFSWGDAANKGTLQVFE